MKNRNLQIRFIKACLRLEDRTGCHVFVYRQAHIDQISAQIHANQWQSGESADIEVSTYYDTNDIDGGEYVKERMLKAIAKINSLEDEVMKLQTDTVLQRQNKVKKLEAELAALKACD